MGLSEDIRNRLRYALASQQAGNEVAAALGGVGTPSGRTFYVQSTSAVASDNDSRLGTSPTEPLATLAEALTRCTASVGDVIVLLPGHAETTTAIAWSVAGIAVIGIGFGQNRPTLTATAAATDLINVTAANGLLINVRLVGAASLCTSLIDGSAAATDFQCIGCEFALAATPLNAMTWSGARPVITDLTVTQTANGADYIVAFEAGVDGFIFKRWDVLCPNGLDNGLVDSGAFAHEGGIFDDITAVGLDTLVVNFVSSTAGPPDSVFGRARIMYSAAITSVEDGVAAATSKGIAYVGPVYAADVTGKRGGLIPLTSAS